MSGPRTLAGRFVSRQCPDAHCDGTLQPDRDEAWRCDGLTHIGDTGPLFACQHGYNPYHDATPSAAAGSRGL